MTAPPPDGPTAATLPTTFEAAYEQLRAILEQLERGSLPLEVSLTLYERGMMLADHCESIVQAAELRVTRIQGTAESDGLDDGTEADYEPAF